MRTTRGVALCTGLLLLGVGGTACTSSSGPPPSRSSARLVFSDGRGFVTAPASRPNDRRRLPAPPAFHGAVPRRVAGAEVAAVVAPRTGVIGGEFLTDPADGPHPSHEGFRLALWGGNLAHPQVVEDLPYTLGIQGLSWSPDGERLYYGRHDDDGRRHVDDRLVVATIGARQRATVHRVPGGRGLLLPAVSPDGGRVAAIRTRYRGVDAFSGELVVVDLVRHRVSPPLIEGTLAERPAWSPDGQWIAIQADGRVVVLRADAPGTATRLNRVTAVRPGPTTVPSTPVWVSSSEIWFACLHPEMDDDRPEPPADLCSVHVHAGRTTEPVNRTDTARADERNLSVAG